MSFTFLSAGILIGLSSAPVSFLAGGGDAGLSLAGFDGGDGLSGDPVFLGGGGGGGGGGGS